MKVLFVLLLCYVQCLDGHKESFFLPVYAPYKSSNFAVTDLLLDATEQLLNHRGTTVFKAAKILNAEHVMHMETTLWQCNYKQLVQTCHCHFVDEDTFTLNYDILDLTFQNEHDLRKKCFDDEGLHEIKVNPCACRWWGWLQDPFIYNGYETIAVPAYYNFLTDVYTIRHENYNNSIKLDDDLYHYSSNTVWKGFNSGYKCRIPERIALDIVEYNVNVTGAIDTVYAINGGDRLYSSENVCLLKGCNDNNYYQIGNLGLFEIHGFDGIKTFPECKNVTDSLLDYETLQAVGNLQADFARNSFALNKLIKNESVTYFEFQEFMPSTVGWHPVYSLKLSSTNSIQLTRSVAFYAQCFWGNVDDYKTYFVCDGFDNKYFQYYEFFKVCPHSQFLCGPNGMVLTFSEHKFVKTQKSAIDAISNVKTLYLDMTDGEKYISWDVRQKQLVDTAKSRNISVLYTNHTGSNVDLQIVSDGAKSSFAWIYDLYEGFKQKFLYFAIAFAIVVGLVVLSMICRFLPKNVFNCKRKHRSANYDDIEAPNDVQRNNNNNNRKNHFVIVNVESETLNHSRRLLRPHHPLQGEGNDSDSDNNINERLLNNVDEGIELQELRCSTNVKNVNHNVVNDLDKNTSFNVNTNNNLNSSNVNIVKNVSVDNANKDEQSDTESMLHKQVNTGFNKLLKEFNPSQQQQQQQKKASIVDAVVLNQNQTSDTNTVDLINQLSQYSDDSDSGDDDTIVQARQQKIIF